MTPTRRDADADADAHYRLFKWQKKSFIWGHHLLYAEVKMGRSQLTRGWFLNKTLSLDAKLKLSVDIFYELNVIFAMALGIKGSFEKIHWSQHTVKAKYVNYERLVKYFAKFENVR